MPNTLPQFSELTTRTNVTTVNYDSSGNDQLHNSQNIIYTTAADSSSGKQTVSTFIIFHIEKPNSIYIHVFLLNAIFTFTNNFMFAPKHFTF